MCTWAQLYDYCIKSLISMTFKGGYSHYNCIICVTSLLTVYPAAFLYVWAGDVSCSTEECPEFTLCYSLSYKPEGECCHKCGDCVDPRPPLSYNIISIIGNAPLPGYIRYYTEIRYKRDVVPLLRARLNIASDDSESKPPLKGNWDGSDICGSMIPQEVAPRQRSGRNCTTT